MGNKGEHVGQDAIPRGPRVSGLAISCYSSIALRSKAEPLELHEDAERRQKRLERFSSTGCHGIRLLLLLGSPTDFSF